MGAVAALWRHPVKSHGREALDAVTLRTGEAMPWDRHWAVTREGSAHDGGWSPCQNFLIGTRIPALAAIWARFDEGARRLTLTHADRPPISFDPDDPGDAARFLDWVRPLVPSDRAGPDSLVRAGSRGMTDTDFPSISLMNRSSHRAVSQRFGRPLEEERWRGNIWFDGLGPWEEFEWLGRRLRVGGAILEVRERIVRCQHTAANPRNGRRDADTLGTLEAGWGHTDFGVYAEVIEGGSVTIGDSVEVLP